MRKIVILLICVLALFAVGSAFAAQQPTMKVNVADIEAGQTAHVSISLPGDAQGKVTVSVNGHDYQAKVVNGKATVDLKGLSAGSYAVKVKYNGEGNYSTVSKEAQLKVSEVKNTSPTHTNASGEPVNATPISNSTINTNNSTDTNTTNTTNTTNNTTPAKKVDNNPVKKPVKKEPKKQNKVLNNKKTGIPVVLLLLVAVGAVIGVVYRRD